MDSIHAGRRQFVKGSLSALALSTLPGQVALAQTTIRNRLEWNDFKTTPDYAAFINAISAMRANTNSADRRSWAYWSNIHVNACPHGIAYFLAWHRGYLHYFQETVRAISGNSTLMVPYWDYYKSAVMPQEFTDSSSGNPLYVPGRVNTNVYSALSLTPFSTKYKNFQRGTVDSFEVAIEYQPHGKFHNVIGGYMAQKTSPMDPIFWLHHGQIDRLWAAWVLAANGRTMPPIGDPYWSGNYTYRSDLTMPRNRAYNTTTYLSYDYVDKTLPRALPPQASAGRLIRVQMPGRSGSGRPAVGNFPQLGPASAGGGRRSIGGAGNVGLDETSVSVQIPVEQPDSQALRSIIERQRGGQGGRGGPPAGPYTSVQIVVENARVLPQGQDGGYFYDVYLNLPQSGGAPDEEHLIGGFGPFEIASHEHHPGSSHLTFPVTQILANTTPDQLRDITLSFVRVSGNNSPRGRVIVLGAVRIELSNDPVQ
jgi:tyrosinase